MKYLEYDDTYWVIDIEGDDLDCHIIWCMGWKNVVTQEKGMCIGHDEVRAWFAARDGHHFIGHNIVRFDAPTLNRLLGTRLLVSRCIDTLILSTIYSPSLDGGHSLGAWGERIGYPKIDFHEWDRLSDQMIEYCHRDVEITYQLFVRMVRVLNKIGFSEKSCYIQHQMTHIIERQRKNGFHFNGREALAFYQRLRKREEELQDEIREVFPPDRVLVRERNAFNKDGGASAQYLRDQETLDVEGPDEFGRYRAYRYDEFNIGSSKQRADKLTALGWVPDERTPKGAPKVTEKSLVKFADEHDIPQAKLITKWMSVNGRANMINTWLNEWNPLDECIHGKLFVADTLRFRHQAPNTANIPAVRVKEVKDGNGKVVEKFVLYGEDGYYTYEARDLWTARAGRVLVGTDAAGLELRMLAHYINRPDFTEQVVNGDPHQYNADLAGVTRPTAKTLLYAIQYGAQAGKVAQIIGGTREEGAILREQFLARLGIKDVMNDAIREQETGRVWLVDGAGVVCPNPHAALNYKLQGGGARVMALASIFLEAGIRRKGLDSFPVGNIHDEVQYDVLPADAEEHGKLAVQSIRDAGEDLNLNVPLDGTSKVGRTWSETH